MPTLAELGRRPAHVVADGHFAPWFAALADRLMNGCDLVVAGTRYRFAELEMYYSGGAHPDPFAHRDPVQLEYGRWYFHRTRGAYRGGSFKGLDLALGNGTDFFGVLIRTVVAFDGTLVHGPCVTVDHMLERTKTASVAALDGLINGRNLWDTSAPLHVVEVAEPRAAPVFATARVGLSLKRAEGKVDAPRFVGRPYRFLTEPRAVSKGRPQLILALHTAGRAPDQIAAVTGVARKVIDKYIADFARGTRAGTFDAHIGTDPSTPTLCQLLGTWHATFGPPQV